MRTHSHLQRLLGTGQVFLLFTIGTVCHAAVLRQVHLSNGWTSLQQYKPVAKATELQQPALSKAAYQRPLQEQQQHHLLSGQQQQQQQQAPHSTQKLSEVAHHVRQLLQAPTYRPKPHSSSETAGHLSGWHMFYLVMLSIFGLTVLGFMAYKAMQWIERSRRPGYVELQSLDTAYHRPWVNL